MRVSEAGRPAAHGYYLPSAHTGFEKGREYCMEESRNVIAEHFKVRGSDYEPIDGGAGFRARINGSGLFYEYIVTARQEGNSVHISVALPVKVLRGEARAVLMGLMDINDTLPDSECFELDIMSGAVSFRLRETRSDWSECEVGQAIDHCMNKLSEMAADIRKVLYGQPAALPGDMAQQGVEHIIDELTERVSKLEVDIIALRSRLSTIESETDDRGGYGYGDIPPRREYDDIPSPRSAPPGRSRSRAGGGGFRIKNPFRSRSDTSYDDDDDDEEYYDDYSDEAYTDTPAPEPRRTAPEPDFEDEHLPSFIRRGRAGMTDEPAEDDLAPITPRRRAVPVLPTRENARYSHFDDDDPDETEARSRPRRR